jgi:pimeloyl-ACP methyl ester carboxylesterase
MAIDLNSERSQILVSKSPPIQISVIDIAPKKSRQTFVFLHGLGADSLQWREQLEYFSASHRVIAIDLRGHGQSDPPASAFDREKSAAEIQEAVRYHKSRHGAYARAYTVWPVTRVKTDWSNDQTKEFFGTQQIPLSMQVLLEDVEAVIKNLKVNVPFVLVGHSLGGAIAAEYAKAHPYQIHRLILLATPARFKLAFFTALKLDAPRWLSPITALGAHRILIQEFHNRVLKYWPGSATFKKLFVDTLIMRSPRGQYHEALPLGELKTHMPSAKEILQPRSAADLNRTIQDFIEAK